MNFKAIQHIGLASMFLIQLLVCSPLHAQVLSAVALPDAPGAESISNLSTSSSISNDTSAVDQSAQGQSTPPASDPSQSQGQQTKRILGIFPNFRAVSANVHLPPQSVKEKFITATQDSFDYTAIFIPAAVAGYNLGTNATPEFGEGAAGYGRYFWHSFLDQTSENYFVEFIVPVITRQDTRYYTLGSGGFFKRTGYALSRAVITRNDAGHETFNTSEIVGAGAASGVSNLYYPSGERTFSNTGTRWALNVGIDAATFVFHEFWPDVNYALFHVKKPTN
jgi:hypothetical protein